MGSKYFYSKAFIYLLHTIIGNKNLFLWCGKKDQKIYTKQLATPKNNMFFKKFFHLLSCHDNPRTKPFSFVTKVFVVVWDNGFGKRSICFQPLQLFLIYLDIRCRHWQLNERYVLFIEIQCSRAFAWIKNSDWCLEDAAAMPRPLREVTKERPFSVEPLLKVSGGKALCNAAASLYKEMVRPLTCHSPTNPLVGHKYSWKSTVSFVDVSLPTLKL